MKIYWLKRNDKPLNKYQQPFLCHHVDGFSSLWKEFLVTYSTPDPHFYYYETALETFLCKYLELPDGDKVRNLVLEDLDDKWSCAWTVERFKKLLEIVYDIKIEKPEEGETK